MGESLTGRLLVASPKLVDPNFARTVVFICSHHDEGAFGVVLNRPVEELEIGAHLPQWEPFLAPPRVAFAGGPVEKSMAIGLGGTDAGAPGAGWTPIDSGIGLVELGRSPGDLDTEPAHLRIFSGYSGWAAGQLEAEIAEDAWFVVEHEPGDVFTANPGSLWRDVLKRQPGRLAMFAYFPTDPASN
jgi:putative transcriptional regulator